MNIPNQAYGIRAVTFSYINSRFLIPKTNNSINIGGYYSNTPYSENGNHWGFILGLQAAIIQDKLTLIGDFTSGDNSLSAPECGLSDFFTKTIATGVYRTISCTGQR